MNWTIDRINRLCLEYGLPSPWSYLEPMNGAGAHEALDKLDVAAGLDTRGCTCSVHWKVGGIPINQVGARIWRHERHLDGAYPYHHLGKSAEAA